MVASLKIWRGWVTVGGGQAEKTRQETGQDPVELHPFCGAFRALGPLGILAGDRPLEKALTIALKKRIIARV